MERNLEDIMTEAKDFQRLTKQHKMARSLEAGLPAYIINKEWLKKYKKYIFFE